MIKENFVELYANSFKNNWDLPGLSDYSEKKTLYYKDLAREIAKVHILLEEAGIKRGDKVALVGKNNIPWCVVYLATIHYGAVIVPILQDFHADNIQHIIHHSEAKLLFCSLNIWDNVDETRLPEIDAVFSTNDLGMKCLFERKAEESAEGEKQTKLSEIVDLLEDKMLAKYPQGYNREDINYAKVDNSEVVLINYTSGTTGFSKGVMLTGNNLAGNVTHAII